MSWDGYAFDIYPYNDPNGTRLVRLTPSKAVQLAFRLPEQGFGMADGQIIIHSAHADATAANFHKHNLVKVVAIQGETETKVGGFFLEEGDFAALSSKEAGGRLLSFRGPNTVYYLERAILREEPFSENAAAGTTRGSFDVDGMWTWTNTYPGGVMTRAMEEGFYEPGPSGTSADAPLLDATWDFNRLTDSNGVGWTTDDSEWQVPWGTSILDLLLLMLKSGLHWRSGPDLDFHAYAADPAVDRTSTTFAADKVRFAAGENIVTEVNRDITASVERTALLVSGNENETVYITGGTSDVTWIGHVQAPISSEADALTAIGNRNLDQREVQVEAAFPLKHIVADDELNGGYIPFIHYVPGDLVTLHTGTGDHDFNDFAIPVAAVRILHDSAGNWFGMPELGAQSISAESKAFEERVNRIIHQPGGHSHPPNPQLCIPGVIGAAFDAVSSLGSACSNDGTNPVSDFPAWAGDQEERVEITVPRGVPAGHSIVVWVATNEDGGQGGLYDHQVYDEQGNTWTLDDQSTPQGSNDIVVEIWRCNVTTALNSGDYIRFAMNVGSSLSTSVEGGRRCIAAYEFTGSLTVPSVGTGGNGFSGSPTVASSATGGLVVAGLTTGGGDPTYDADWENAVDIISSTLSLVGQFLIPGANESWTPSYSGSSTDWSITTVGYTTGAGTAGAVNDGHPDLVGTSIRAARCDHRHDVHRDTAPTVNDDWATAGYKLGTIWAQLDDLTTPTEIVGVWMLVDNSEGAAVWLEWPGGSPTAADVSITDTGGYFTGTDVEAALQELGADIASGADLDALAHGITLFTMHKESDNLPYLLWSRDGVTFTEASADPMFDYGFSSRDPSVLHWDNAFWVATTGPSDLAKFSVARSDRLLSGWPSSPTVQPDCSAISPGPFRVWAPEWFIDPAAELPRILFAASATDFDDFSIYEIHPTDREMTTWSTPVQVTGLSTHTNMIDPWLVYAPHIGTTGKPYKLFYKQERSEGPGIALAEAASATGPYTVIETDDWAGWVGARASIEGFSVIEIEDGRWRAYFTENDGFGTFAHWCSDSVDEWDTWSTPVETDWPWTPGHGTPLRLRSVLDHEHDRHAHADLFDSLTTDHGELTGLADDDHTQYLNEARHDDLDHSGLSGVDRLFTVDPGTVTYDHSGDDVVVSASSVWGYDADGPYYDDAGVATGEEAILALDSQTGEYTLIPYNP